MIPSAHEPRISQLPTYAPSWAGQGVDAVFLYGFMSDQFVAGNINNRFKGFWPILDQHKCLAPERLSGLPGLHLVFGWLMQRDEWVPGIAVGVARCAKHLVDRPIFRSGESIQRMLGNLSCDWPHGASGCCLLSPLALRSAS